MQREDFSDTDEWTRQLLAHFRSPRYQPPVLPVTAVELMSLTQQAVITTGEVVAIFEKDPLLSAKLLMHSLSAPHGPWEPQSLAEAAERIGLEQLRRIVFEVSLNTRVFQAPEYTEALERLRVHSLATAHLVPELCSRLNVPGRFGFLAGLLHDVGIAGLFVALADLPDRPNLSHAWSTVLRLHAEASASLAQLWRLPRRTHLLLANHHSIHIEGRPDTLLAVMVLAERLAFELAPPVGSDTSTPDRPRRMPGKDVSSQAVVQSACTLLRVDGALWAELREVGAMLLTRLFFGRA